MPADAIILQAKGFDVAAPGANADIFSTEITPRYQCSAFRVTVALATASVFNVAVTNGATTRDLGLNSSVALQAGDLYTFAFGVNPANTYNFRVETDGIIRYIQIDEVPTGVL